MKGESRRIWLLPGAMTILCGNEPALGRGFMNRIVLALAVAGASLAAVSSANAASMAMGSYECWGNGEARMLMNFKVTGANSYIGSDNSKGTYTLGQGNKVNFTSGSLNGVMPDGFTATYVIRQGVPVVTFVGPSGAEAQYCEHVKR